MATVDVTALHVPTYATLTNVLTPPRPAMPIGAPTVVAVTLPASGVVMQLPPMLRWNGTTWVTLYPPP
ncbi:MAG TPA: hypothetical protein VK453_24285 [Micromonosporaceae bacterium]|nr:hypothetical protein [Micromonosporaceae bacterium]